MLIPSERKHLRQIANSLTRLMALLRIGGSFEPDLRDAYLRHLEAALDAVTPVITDDDVRNMQRPFDRLTNNEREKMLAEIYRPIPGLRDTAERKGQ